MKCALKVNFIQMFVGVETTRPCPPRAQRDPRLDTGDLLEHTEDDQEREYQGCEEWAVGRGG